jgi:integrase
VSVHRTPSGRWRARWRVEGNASRSQTFDTRRQAEHHLAGIRVAKAAGTFISQSAGAVSVNAWADEWLAGAMNLGDGGRETYRRDLDAYILPALGPTMLNRLSTSMIDGFLSEELERLAASTVHRHYRTIRRMLKVAVDRGRLARNPCDLVTPPKIPDREMHFLAVDEVQALAEAISPRYRAWVLGSVGVGWRWSEGVGLRRERIDGPRITISEQLIRRSDGEWHRDRPKTRAGRRVVTAPQFVAEALVAHGERWSEPGPAGLVFVNQLGRPMGHSFGANVFKPALRRAGLPPTIRIHDLRHTSVALAIAAGAHPKAIQMRTGHASITITLDRYGHLFPEIDGDVADGMDRLWRP